MSDEILISASTDVGVIKPKNAVLLVFAAMVSAIIVGAVLSRFMSHRSAAALGEMACYLVPPLLIVISRKERRAILLQLGLLRDWRLILLIPATTVAISFAVSVVVLLVESLIPIPKKLIEYLVGLMSADSPFELLYVATVVAVIPAFGEELLFRGIVQRSLVSRFGVAAGICLAALLFSLVHLNPWSFVSTFVLGTFFGLVTYKTGAFWAGSIGHFAANITGVVVVNATDTPDYVTLTAAYDWYVVALSAIGAVIGLAAILRICRQKKRMETSRQTMLYG